MNFTFAPTAEIEASMNNREHFERARKYSGSAVETIRRFESKIADPHLRREILQGAEDLQKRNYFIRDRLNAAEVKREGER